MKSFSIRTDRTDVLRAEYSKELDCMSYGDVIKEFFSYLDYTEETDSGNIIHPITIGSCRVLMSEPLDMVLQELRKRFM